MAYLITSNTVIDNTRASSFANVTIQNNGFLEVNDSNQEFQGTISGYNTGGAITVPPTVTTNRIDKFPFATDTNASSVGNLTVGRYGPAGQSSTTHGYTSGGYISPGFSNRIDKFSFAINSNASDVGILSQTRILTTGQSSTTHGYTSGGWQPGVSNRIDKFLFSVDTNATTVGNLTESKYGTSGQSSSTHGYNSGGFLSPSTPTTNKIEKFPFSSDTNSSNVGDLIQARRRLSGQSSTTHGYASGGAIPPSNPISVVNTIEKFPFSSDTNATNVGNLTQEREDVAGISSIVSGYSSGGSSPAFSERIDKFPFSSDTNATTVGNLTQARRNPAGQQD